MHKVSFIDTPTIPMNGVGKRSINQITPLDDEIQSLGSQTITNTFIGPWFECQDLLKLLALELDAEALNCCSLVSKAFRSVYVDALVENINAEKDSFNKLIIHSLEKFVDLLKFDSQRLLILNLIARRPNLKNKWLVDEPFQSIIVEKFSKLHSLSFKHCNLRVMSFYDNFKLLPLKKLNLSYCRLTFQEYGKENCNFRSLSFLHNFTALEVLDIRYLENSWHLHFEFLIHFTCLKVLNLPGNSLNSQIFKDMTSLESLDISDLGGVHFFDYDGLKNCTQLKVLNLAGNSLTSQIFNHLTSLESLDISHLRGNHFDYNDLKSCTKLKVLNLAGNSRPNLDFLKYCTQINELNLKGCKNVSLLPFYEFFKGRKFTYVQGDTYEGKFINGKPEGHSKYSNAEGIKKFEGNVIAGKYNGLGASFYDNGKTQYAGNFVNGDRCGEGVLYNSQGLKIVEGIFLGNLPKEGVFYNSQGNKVFEGTFSYQILKEGIIDLKNGAKFEGEILSYQNY